MLGHHSMTTKNIFFSFMHRLSVGAAVALMALALGGCAGQEGRKELTTGSIPKLSKPVQSINATELAAAA